MRQVVLLDLHDLANLRRGQPLIIQTGNGQAIEIGFDGKLPAALPTLMPTKPIRLTDKGAVAPSSAKTKAPPKRQHCPYCKVAVTSLGTHIRQLHPDKGLVASGGSKCRWCPKRWPHRRSALRHEMMKHLTEYRAQMKGGNEVKGGNA